MPQNELQTGNGVWRVDMMKCPYHDTCAEYGCPELCRCFCDSDDVSYTGLHPKLIWERSMTLGRGNDRCDFLHENHKIDAQEAKKMKKEETKPFIRWCIAAAVYEKKHSAHLAG